jgi:hypothetical protein
MNASGDLADVHLAGNLLVRAPDSQQRYDLPLAGCQGRESLLELRHHLLFGTPSAGALNAASHRIKQFLISKWFGQEFYGAGFMARTDMGISPWPVMNTIGV